MRCPIPARAVATLVLLAYVAIMPFAGWGALKFLRSTSTLFEPPADTLVGKTTRDVLPMFTTQILHEPLYLIFKSPDGSSFTADRTVTAALCNVSHALRDYLFDDACDGKCLPPSNPLTVAGYCFATVPEERAATVGGENNSTSVIAVDMNPRKTLSANDAARDAISARVEALVAGLPGQPLNVQTTSAGQIARDLVKGLVGNLLRIDSYVLPIALVLLVLCLRSLRYLVVPLLALPVTVAISFGLSYIVTVFVKVSAVAPEMASATMLALTIDYSLFILSRFTDCVQHAESAGEGVTAESRAQVVYDTARLAAHNIVVSGMTIAVALGSIAVFPVEFIATIGYIFFLSTTTAVIVSMTLMPALLLVFYDFFRRDPIVLWLTRRVGGCVGKACGKCCRCCSGREDDETDPASARSLLGDDVPAIGSSSPLPTVAFEHRGGGLNGDADVPEEGRVSLDITSPINRKTLNRYSGVDEESRRLIDQFESQAVEVEQQRIRSCVHSTPAASSLVDTAFSRPSRRQRHLDRLRRDQKRSWWFKVGTLATRFPVLVALAVCAMGAPLFYTCSLLRVGFSFFDTLPRNSDHAKLLEHLVKDVGHGSTAPFYVTIRANETGAIVSPDVVAINNDLFGQINRAFGPRIGSMLSFAHPPGSTSKYDNMFLPYIWEWLVSHDVAYGYLFNMTVDKTRTAALIRITSASDPWSRASGHLLDELLRLIEHFDTRDGRVHIGLGGLSVNSWSMQRDVMRVFPYQVAATFGVIFVFISVVFRSVLTPFRMVFTVAYTVAAAGGGGVLVFQFKWLHSVWKALDGCTSFDWNVPIFSFSLLCALALDYDIFLLTRIVEFKAAGFTDRAAIRKAVWKTGPIISFAGVIMAVSFGSLALTDMTVLNQFGVVALIAVLLDTFVVRTFFVPSLMAVAPHAIWWPRKFPLREREEDDMGERLDD